MNRTVSFGELVNATFGEISVNRTIVFIYLAIATSAGTIGNLFDTKNTIDVFGIPVEGAIPFADLGGGALAPLVSLGVFVVGVLLTYWLYAALIERQTAPGFRRFWAFILVYILSIIGIGLAALALIVPGIIVAVRWVPLIPALLARDEPLMDSFSTSWQLTSGSSWPIFGAALVLVVVGLVVSFVFELAASLVAGLGPIGVSVFTAAGASISGMLFIVFAVATWRSLAAGGAEAAAVFE